MGSRKKTARIAAPITLDSKKVYVERAKRALPLLVQQASAGQPVTYEDLATELGMQNPRNLNYVLGSIGTTLQRLSREWREDIPPLQSLVVRKTTHLPGLGFDNSGQVPPRIRHASMHERRRIVDALHFRVFAYPRWHQVLRTFRLPASPPVIAPAPPTGTTSRGGAGGESPEHLAFKLRIRNSPAILGLKTTWPEALIEFALPTGDEIDVLFRDHEHTVVVEAKSHISDDADVKRGVFQCLKYGILLDAMARLEGARLHCRLILAVEAAVGADIRRMCSLLDVSLCERLGTIVARSP